MMSSMLNVMIKRYKQLIYLLLLVCASSSQVAFGGTYDDFFAAIRNDRPGVIVDLLKRGFDANTLDPKGLSGLYLAVAEPSFKVAKVLIDWPKTDVDARTLQDESPLMMASLKGYLELAKQLIERGGDVNKTGWTPLHYAATGGHVEIIKLLLEEHAYIDAESPNGSTPLMMAAMYGTAAAAKLLMEEGADPSIKNELGLTAIDFAQKANRQDVVEAIAKTVRSREPAGKW